MTEEEILKQAIGKAFPMQDIDTYDYPEISVGIVMYYSYYELIFSHDFAKAFWGRGDRKNKEYMNDIYPQELWAYHLQRMVLEENPIKYLEKFL